MVTRALLLILALPGCGLVAGLRTDYELGDASNEAATEGGAADGSASDSAADSGNGNDAGTDGACPMPTDTNCGGPNCPKCAIGQKCKQDPDCQSGNCSNGRCKN